MFSLMTQALGNADLPVIEGVAIAGALLVVVANLRPTSCTRGWTRACGRLVRPCRTRPALAGRLGAVREPSIAVATDSELVEQRGDPRRRGGVADGQSAVVTGPLRSRSRS